MSTDPVQHPTPERHPPTGGAGPGTIAYRIIVVLLLGVCAWFLNRSPHPASKPALALPGNTWRRGTAEMEFRDDGSISQLGSGHGTFKIISPDEILLDTKGLFGWPGNARDFWSVETVGVDLLLQRKVAPNDRVVLHRVRKPDEQATQILETLQRIQQELAEQGRARKSENEAIRREIQLLRDVEKKRVEEGKK